MFVALTILCMFITAALLEVLLLPNFNRGRRFYIGLMLASLISATLWMAVLYGIMWMEWGWKLRPEEGFSASKMTFTILSSGLIWSLPCLAPAGLGAWLCRRFTPDNKVIPC